MGRALRLPGELATDPAVCRGHPPARLSMRSQAPRPATPHWYLSLLSALGGLTSSFTLGARPPVAEPSGLALRSLWGLSHIPDSLPGMSGGQVRGCGGHHRRFRTRSPSSVDMISPKVNGITRKKRQELGGDSQHPKPWLQPAVWVQRLGMGPWWGSWRGGVGCWPVRGSGRAYA